MEPAAAVNKGAHKVFFERFVAQVFGEQFTHASKPPLVFSLRQFSRSLLVCSATSCGSPVLKGFRGALHGIRPRAQRGHP